MFTMNEAIQYMDIIFLAVVAGIVLLRLRSVLGKRTGSEKKTLTFFHTMNQQVSHLILQNQ